MDLGGASVRHRLGAMRCCGFGIRRLLALPSALRWCDRARASRSRARLARPGLSSPLCIVHDAASSAAFIICQVPRVGARNQPVSPDTASGDQVPLLDARLVLTEQLTADERSELAGLSVPVITVDPGPLELPQLLSRHRAFGATVFEGLVMSSLRIGGQTGIHLLGPGDLLVPRNELWPTWLAELDFRTATSARLGLLGNDLLAAIYQWPRLLQGLYKSLGDQLQRLNVQLVVCQLPRVEDRVMAMLWLLADSWGHVTPGGVRVPLALTHETLGGLVGARRPTVTLALRKLTDDGALVPQDHGWLLVAPPPQPEEPTQRIAPVPPDEVPIGPWAAWPRGEAQEDPSITYAELRDTVDRLREQHASERQQTRDRLTRVRTDRVRIIALRKRIVEDALRRRQPPSS
ncbi:MAG TPA: helix-turn-helix domain-containing protein [Solirubrobacteraceae bacterium]|nr:helix-turn-helix domain-containing protein [Solirubrobacteraceae bacterium]